MVEASPAPPLVSELKTEFALRALRRSRSMRQRSLVVIDECVARGVSSGKVESQYFVGAGLAPSGHSTSSHSTGCGVVRFCSPARRGARERRRSGKQAARSIPPARQRCAMPFCLSSEPSL